MEKEVLRRVQLEQLEILKEIHRVCVENDIPYFLDSGTLIGAVRHNGFIPWDDDLDIGMLRPDYEKFCEIAPKKLNEKYSWQSWKNDKNYALPFGKVRRNNTVYIEEKAGKLKNCGFYVDVFPYDNAPANMEERRKLLNKYVFWARCMLMKHGYTPWHEHGKTNLKKRLGYMVYQFISLFFSHDAIVQKYEGAVLAVSDSEDVYEQYVTSDTKYYKKAWLSDVTVGIFEERKFFIPIHAHEILTETYGDYMKLPPEDQRENRHGILKIIFSNGEEYDNV